jgi:predicted thioredoxin/glutaredoxin
VAPQVLLITRKGCHLCDEALSLLRDLGVEPELADVDADEALFDLYDWRVPVVLLDGASAAEGKITRDELSRALSESGGGSNVA